MTKRRGRKARDKPDNTLGGNLSALDAFTRPRPSRQPHRRAHARGTSTDSVGHHGTAATGTAARSTHCRRWLDDLLLGSLDRPWPWGCEDSGV
eukprot:scaffold6931_cov119-Isochrysis_galbana.AAC.5